jgi:hypothetical protein
VPASRSVHPCRFVSVTEAELPRSIPTVIPWSELRTIPLRYAKIGLVARVDAVFPGF